MNRLGFQYHKAAISFHVHTYSNSNRDVKRLENVVGISLGSKHYLRVTSNFAARSFCLVSAFKQLL